MDLPQKDNTWKLYHKIILRLVIVPPNNWFIQLLIYHYITCSYVMVFLTIRACKFLAQSVGTQHVLPKWNKFESYTYQVSFSWLFCTISLFENALMKSVNLYKFSYGHKIIRNVLKLLQKWESPRRNLTQTQPAK